LLETFKKIPKLSTEGFPPLHWVCLHKIGLHHIYAAVIPGKPENSLPVGFTRYRRNSPDRWSSEDDAAFRWLPSGIIKVALNASKTTLKIGYLTLVKSRRINLSHFSKFLHKQNILYL
jgi:hypothetical protein